jgi:uncharacterized membrane protein
MVDYEHSIMVKAPADDVFAFVSNLNNIPRYLPQLQGCVTRSRNRMGASESDAPARLESLETDAWFHVDPTDYFIEWSAGSDCNYSGWLEITDMGERCELTVHLTTLPDRHAVAPASETASSDMDNGIRSALQTVKRLMEREPAEQAAVSRP